MWTFKTSAIVIGLSIGIAASSGKSARAVDDTHAKCSNLASFAAYTIPAAMVGAALPFIVKQNYVEVFKTKFGGDIEQSLKQGALTQNLQDYVVKTPLCASLIRKVEPELAALIDSYLKHKESLADLD
jgi:hypothetical protein